MSKLFSMMPWTTSNSQTSETSSSCQIEGDEKVEMVQIEDFPLGYPRFSAFIAALDNFQVFRRFSHVRTRLLLLKQDRIVELEERLNDIDRDETKEVFHATRRGDRNEDRKAVVEELDKQLESFDNLMVRNHRVSSFPKPRSRYIENIENWLDWNPCIAREETDFLSRHDDLLVLNTEDDLVLSWMDRLVTLWLKHVGVHMRDDSKSLIIP
ncbi:hypothetical protein N0V82_008604 [Gnomoniopsis sp. IMI 355080]|nr:hypothetical protein N0V82_008604 [Gnomoniopsis sp. IMI 355080]